MKVSAVSFGRQSATPTVEDMAGSLGLSIVGHLQKPVRLKALEEMIDTHRELHAQTTAEQAPQVIILDADLRMAIERDQFVLHYQPQIDIATRRVVGVEALVRWQYPGQGLVFPDHFIGRAEKLGLIDQLGWFVVNRSLSDVERFADQANTPVKMSVNVSPHSLHDMAFPDTLLKLVHKHGAVPENLILEITESGVIQESSDALGVLTRVRMNGVLLSIDDFGTGYSMMAQLRNIPATELKIDRAFVSNMHARDGDRIMVRKTIEIGHELGMRVVAEGVETLEQLHLLRSYNCDTAQGFFFTRPLPAQELSTWLEAYRAQHRP